jgi:murein DD-endopeptidase MepM/ murein hydrolase activator NlpD
MNLKSKRFLIYTLLVFILAASGTATILRVGPQEKPIAVVVDYHIPPFFLNAHLPLKEQPEAASFIIPIAQKDFKMWSSPYGERDPEDVGGYGDDFHNGLDLYGTWLARVISAAPGIVWVHFHPPGGKWKGHPVLGGMLVIRHDFGGKTWWTVYGHLSQTEVHEDDIVDTGDYVARQGNTGASLSPHVHFEIHEGGECNRKTGEITGSIEHNPLQFIGKIDAQ